MMVHNKVSVIVPFYNAEKYISECLASVARQTLQEIEIICVNDGSKDASGDIANEFSRRDKRVKIIENDTNHGQAYARNRGIERASGQYLYFMDADDALIDDNALQSLYDCAERDSLDCVVFNAKTFYEQEGRTDCEVLNYYMEEYDGEVVAGKEFLSRLMLHGRYQCTVWQQFWNAKFIRENQLFFGETLSPHEDYFFSFQAYLSCKRVKCIDEFFYLHCRREISSTQGDFSVKRLRAYLGCYREAYKLLLNDDIGEDAVPIFLWHLGITEGNIRNGAKELINNNVDVCNSDVFSNSEKVFLEKVLSTGYSHLKRYWTLVEYKKIKDAGHVIVYGAGAVGMEVLKRLREYGFTDILCAVTDKGENNSLNLGGRIYSIKDLVSYKNDSIVLVSVGKKHQAAMIGHLKQLGFKKYMTMV